MTPAVLAAGSGGGTSREMLGVAVAACSALLYDAGYVLEKQALVDLPPVRLHPVDLLRTAAASPRWVAGFVAMLAGLGLQVVALTLAPVSVVQPILAGGLIALAAAGSTVLGERLSGRHKVALGLVLAAVVLTAVSARGGGQLAEKVPADRFALMAVVVAAAAALAVATNRLRRPGAAGLAAVAVGAGLLYGLGAVAEKAVATRLHGYGLVGGALSSLGTAYPWLFLVVTLCGMLLFQTGLQAHPASLMASLTNVVSTACALAGASVVFGEALLPPGWWSAPRLAGLIAVIAAVAVLAGDREPDGDPLRPDHAVAP